jgi:hypothetical protein
MEYHQFSCGCKFPIQGYFEDGKPKIDLSPTIENIPLDCSRTWEMLGRGDTFGVFQLESNQCAGFSKKLKPSTLGHLAALVSIIRPGVIECIEDGKSMTNHYIDRKNGVEPVKYFHPALENSLKNTYGIAIYQENVLQISRDIAGFSLQEADLLRKCVDPNCTVELENGEITKIGDVNIGQKIKTLDGYTTILDKFNNGEQLVYKFIFNNGQFIVCTDTHKLLCEDGICYSAYDIFTKRIGVQSINGIIFIEKITKAEIIETIDIYVDHPKNIYYLNGIASHNSIGKKSTELMAKCRTMFIDGCKKQGIVNEAEATQLFDWISVGQRYAFNKCVSLDTIVETKYENKTIDNIEIGDVIKTKNNEYTTILDKINTGIQDIYEVELENGKKIKCTLAHKFVCSDNKLYTLQEIFDSNYEIICE